MLFDDKLERLISENEGSWRNKKDKPKFIFDRRNVIYSIDSKFYRLPIIDLENRVLRLVETDDTGKYLYDENGKKIKRNVSIYYFGENVKSVFQL